MPLGTEIGLGSGDVVLDADPAPPHEKGHSSPHFSAHVYCGETIALSATAELLLCLNNNDVDGIGR